MNVKDGTIIFIWLLLGCKQEIENSVLTFTKRLSELKQPPVIEENERISGNAIGLFMSSK